METGDLAEIKSPSLSTSSGFNPREDNDSSAKELSVPTAKRSRSDVAGEIPIPLGEHKYTGLQARRGLVGKILWIGEMCLRQTRTLGRSCSCRPTHVRLASDICLRSWRTRVAGATLLTAQSICSTSHCGLVQFFLLLYADLAGCSLPQLLHS